ncbi:MAG: SO_0444 family Cu/Zn efflux transporter [Thalassotalea sp.]
MSTLELFFLNFISLLNEASPWLLLGLIIAGLMKVCLPAKILSQHLGGGKLAIIKAAFIGAPLPLCSCGVIPVATELRRSGASKSATAAFLVATPETGVDSISVSYALLGPIFAIYRPIAAIFSAIFTGLLVLGEDNKQLNETTKTESTSSDTAKQHACCSTAAPVKAVAKESSDCCSKTAAPQVQKQAVLEKIIYGLQYAATRLLDDLIIWLAIGLLFATTIKTFVPTSYLLEYGSGIIAMLMMVVISIPMYICATASTPVAAGLLMAGLSPGTALVFMLAGPATNISTLGVIKNELGTLTLIKYLTGVVVSALGFGLLLDWLVKFYDLNVVEHMQHSHSVVPVAITYLCSGLLVFLALKPLRQLFFKTLH